MRAASALVAALALSGCETLGYYGQAISGHLDLMRRARPVAALLADPQLPAALRERLELAQRIRDFASRELGLPDNGAYRSYAALDRPFAVWNVVAAPEFSLEPLTWCFPVAGCVAYRGFFEQAAAEAYAARLRAAGHDVYVYGVAAYSTLGRFDDPLLSTFVERGEVELARLIFHELAHQVAYAADDTAFNESFAVAVEREGLRRWLRDRPQALARLAALEARAAEVQAQMEATRARLAALYREPLDPETKRRRKAAELAALRAALGAHARLSGVEPNNAVLAAHAVYTRLVPQFERLLAEEGGDLPRFYERVRGLAAAEPRARGAFAPQAR
ncbi:MAG: aminopeptidase [Burkholderiales bacterium]|nr:aminopeptidase [Burkholderiales bacterium]